MRLNINYAQRYKKFLKKRLQFWHQKGPTRGQEERGAREFCRMVGFFMRFMRLLLSACEDRKFPEEPQKLANSQS